MPDGDGIALKVDRIPSQAKCFTSSQPVKCGHLDQQGIRMILFDLIANDFFEGLHCGHYPRRCAVCGKVFLMCDATRQKYCNSPASIKVRRKILTCKLYAAAMGKKERAKDDPVVRVYDRICQYIYTAKSRKQLTASDEEDFCRHAAQLKEKVRRDSSYSFEAYTADMAALVAKVKQRMNG